MRVSVVMPCYNAGRWVGDALRSVAGQTLLPHEIIVIDDGSTDNSVQNALDSGVALKLVRTERANGAGARNAGIRTSTGDWIAFLDADDLWHANHLERAGQLLQGGTDVAYLNNADSILGGTPQIIHNPSRWPLSQPTASLTHQQYMTLAAGRFYFAMSACVIRRDVLVAIGGLDETQVRRHDIDVWMRAIYSRTWSYDPVSSSVYREDTPGAISRNIANREYYFLRAFLKNREAYAGPALDKLVQIAARRTMSAAFTDGDRHDLQRALQLAWPELNPHNRRLFRLVRLCPFLFRQANLLRRRITMRRR